LDRRTPLSRDTVPPAVRPGPHAPTGQGQRPGRARPFAEARHLLGAAGRLPDEEGRIPYVRRHAAEALNFQITPRPPHQPRADGGPRRVLFLVVVVFGGMHPMRFAAYAAGRGDGYRYPIAIRMVS